MYLELAMRSRNDNVILMLSEMNREVFERVWVLPQLQLLWERIMKIDPRNHLIEYLYALRGASDVGMFIERSSAERGMKRARIVWGSFSGGRREKESLLPALFVLHTVYDRFRQLSARVVDGEDAKIIDEIADGKLLGDDKRLEHIRGKKFDGIMQFRAKKADSAWLSRCFYAKYAALERLAIKELLDEVEARVTARNDGLSEILGLR